MRTIVGLLAPFRTEQREDRPGRQAQVDVVEHDRLTKDLQRRWPRSRSLERCSGPRPHFSASRNSINVDVARACVRSDFDGLRIHRGMT